MHIRILGEDDVDIFREIRLRGLKDHPSAFGSSYEDEVQRPLEQVRASIVTPPEQQITVGAFVDDQLIGVGTFSRMSGKKRQHRGIVTRMYVAPEARGQGAGRAIIQALIDHAHNLDGMEYITLTVESGNTAAFSLYQSVGFHHWGTEPKYLKIDGRYYDLKWMILSLIDK